MAKPTELEIKRTQVARFLLAVTVLFGAFCFFLILTLVNRNTSVNAFSEVDVYILANKKCDTESFVNSSYTPKEFFRYRCDDPTCNKLYVDYTESKYCITYKKEVDKIESLANFVEMLQCVDILVELKSNITVIGFDQCYKHKDFVFVGGFASEFYVLVIFAAGFFLLDLVMAVVLAISYRTYLGLVEDDIRTKTIVSMAHCDDSRIVLDELSK
jgi:hypothetical protein